MTKTAVYTDKAPKPRPIYNQAIVANGFVFCSGQLPKDINGRLVGGTVQDRTLSSLSFRLHVFLCHEISCTRAER
jgi:enamine deaminase RidA (YjgF/YER057c/UK114 family)